MGHPQISGGSGYIFILNNNGMVRSKVCCGNVNSRPDLVP
jgi:hypothetical protein